MVSTPAFFTLIDRMRMQIDGLIQLLHSGVFVDNLRKVVIQINKLLLGAEDGSNPVVVTVLRFVKVCEEHRAILEELFASGPHSSASRMQVANRVATSDTG